MFTNWISGHGGVICFPGELRCLTLGFRRALPERGGKTEILTTNRTNFHEWGRIQMLIGLGFYSCAFASLVEEGGFAADLGRFGETTLPLGFRWALPRLPVPLRSTR
jgi:hypothetical protein